MNENVELDILAGVPCPIKHIFREKFDSFLEKEKDIVCFPSDEIEDNPYENILEVKSKEEIPKIISFGRINEYYSMEFINKMIKNKWFKKNKVHEWKESFKEAGCIDPENIYEMYAACPTVIAVDKSMLGDLPMPSSWKDLMNPIYKDKIIISGPGQSGIADETILLYYYKYYGEEGIRKLARNIKGTYHVSEIGRMISENSRKRAAIYVQWLFFAEAYPRKENFEIIWPQEGAFITPLCLLTKSDDEEKLIYIKEFMTGKKLGDTFEHNGFISANKDSKGIYGDAKLNWLGWDYIKANDVNTLKIYIEDLFKKYFETYKTCSDL